MTEFKEESIILHVTSLDNTIFQTEENKRFFSDFGGLEDACRPLVPKFTGSNPAKAVGFFRARKSPACLPSERK
jgi:hypothetical protein